MSDPRELLDALSAPFPPHAIERREGGGGKMLDYVATETVIRRLNHAVGVWDFRVTEIKVMPTGDANLLVVWGELTVPGLGTRAGTGVQIIHARGGEDMWKGAASDCLKKCATLFNVGIDLYGPDLEAGELPAQPLPPRARTTSQNTVPREPQPIESTNTVTGWTPFWAEITRLGFKNDKKALEETIGVSLGNDPTMALEKVRAWIHDFPTNYEAITGQQRLTA